MKVVTVEGVEFSFDVKLILVNKPKELCVAKVELAGATYISKWMPVKGGGIEAKALEDLIKKFTTEVKVYKTLLECPDTTSVKLHTIGSEEKKVAEIPFTNGDVEGNFFLMEYSRVTISLGTTIRSILEVQGASAEFETTTGIPYTRKLITDKLDLIDTATNPEIFSELIRDYFVINIDLNRCGVHHKDMALRNILAAVTGDGDTMMLSFDYDLSELYNEPTTTRDRGNALILNLGKMEVMTQKFGPLPYLTLIPNANFEALFPPKVEGGGDYKPATNAEALWRCFQIASKKEGAGHNLAVDASTKVLDYFYTPAFREFLMSIRGEAGKPAEAGWFETNCYHKAAMFSEVSSRSFVKKRNLLKTQRRQ